MHTTLLHEGRGAAPQDLEITLVPRNQTDESLADESLGDRKAGDRTSGDALADGGPADEASALSGLDDSFGFRRVREAARAEPRGTADANPAAVDPRESAEEGPDSVWNAVWHGHDRDPGERLAALTDLDDPSAEARAPHDNGLACGLLPPGFDLGGVSIIRLIGEGGMGRVYEAWQSSPRRRVAVKVIRDAFMSQHDSSPRCGVTAVIRRFNLEADVLAGLRHPHIAQIYSYGTYRVDGAATPGGNSEDGPSAGGLSAGGAAAGGEAWPFFVMEYIPDARPITRFVAARRLSIRDTVRLFGKVCDAVAHAHARGVTHRDLKPANVLVAADGEPKVIDFGVAHLDAGGLSRSAAGASGGGVWEGGAWSPEGPVTGPHDVCGTVLYMSPEHLRGAAAADARSDVYSLGLVLHQLLTGTLPDDIQSRPLSEVLRLVTADSPADTSRVRAAAVAACGRDDARSLAVIVATCLEKSPADRYPSAAELAADLGRWSSGLPILARPQTALESLGRFARRHRGAALATIATIATLAASLMGITVFSIRAERQRQRAEEAVLAAAASQQTADDERRAAEEARAIAEEASGNAESARAVAEEALAEAQRRAAETRSQLYFSNVMLAAEARDRDNLAEARRLLEAARRLATDAGSPRPIELDCLAASLDEAAIVFRAEAADVALQPQATHHGVEPPGSPSGLPAARPSAGTMNRVTPGTVTSVAWSPDGRFLAVGDAEGRVWRRDVAHPHEPPLALGDHRDVVWSLAFSPDGRLLASASADGTVIVRDTAEGMAVASMEPHDGPMYAVAFAPDGGTLAFAGRPGVIELWDTATWVVRDVLRGHSGTVFAVSVSADGRILASAGADRTVRIWDLTTRLEAGVLDDHGARVFDVAVSPDGSAVASAGEDGHARIWDLSDRAPRAVLRHPFRVNAVEFADDGHRLLTASADGVVRVWDAAAVPEADTAGRSAAIRPAGGRYLSGLLGHELGVWSLAVRPDGRTFASGSADATTRIWRLAPPLTTAGIAGTGSGVDREPPAGVLDEGARVLSVAVSPAGDLLATGLSSGVVRVRDAATLRPRADLFIDPETDARHEPAAAGGEPVGTHRVHAVTFALDGLSLAAAGDEGIVCLWSLVDDHDGAIEATAIRLRPHARRIYTIAFAPDGRRLVTASEDRTARIMHVPAVRGHLPAGTATGGQAASDDGQASSLVLRHPSRVFCAVFSPDGRLVATACEDRVARLWDAVDGRELARLPAADSGEPPADSGRSGDGHAGPVNWLSFSPDGSHLATASSDGTVRVWTINPAVGDGGTVAIVTARLAQVLQGPARQVWKVVYSPDGTRLAAVSADGTGQIWDAASGRAALMLRGHADEVWAVAFAANGRTLLTGSWDGTTRIWGLSAAELHRRCGGMPRCPVRPLAEFERGTSDDSWQATADDAAAADVDFDDETGRDLDDDPDADPDEACGEEDPDHDLDDGNPYSHARDPHSGGCARGGCTR